MCILADLTPEENKITDIPVEVVEGIATSATAVTEKYDENPAYYDNFSKKIKEALEYGLQILSLLEMELVSNKKKEKVAYRLLV